MSRFELKLPIRNCKEVLTVKSIDELSGLVDDADERAIVSQCLLWFYSLGVRDGKAIRMGDIEEMFTDMSQRDRRFLLELWRRKAGLKAVADIEADERFEEANHAARIRALRYAENPPRLVIRPGGAIVEEGGETEAEQARLDALLRSRAARFEAQAAERAAAAAERDDYEKAREAQARRELPTNFPGSTR